MKLAKILLLWAVLAVIFIGLSGCGFSHLDTVAMNTSASLAKIIDSVAPAANLGNIYCKAGDVPNFGTTDGPAALPKACFFTAMSATPSNGNVTTVLPGHFQEALDAVQCGDTLVLTAGKVYQGSFTLPALNCDKQHYITIRTSALNLLPPEGTRVSPCYYGIPSLPGRPVYSCPWGGPKALMPQILADIVNKPAIDAAVGAKFYRLIGLNIAQAPGVRQNELVNLIQTDHIILDRMWIHGSRNDENQSGVDAAGTYIAVIDSYLNDSKCLTSGACIDSQGIHLGQGSWKQGPIKIVNNFLESAGESFISGGAAATMTPYDFEIRRNHSFKPLIWRNTNPGYIGIGPIIKNLGELKNGIRALIEANIFEQNWEGQSDQAGFAFLLTPKSQSNACPTCIVTDVTFRFNTIRHVNQGMQIVSILSDAGGAAQGIHRVSVHDNLMDDVDYAKWTPDTKGSCCVGGLGFEITNNNSGKAISTSAISIDHNTVLASNYKVGANFILEIDPLYENFPIVDLTVTNNISPAGIEASINTGGGAPIMNVLLALNDVNAWSWVVASNLFPMETSATYNYPASNQICGSNSATCFPEDMSGLFYNYKNGDGGDYRLLDGSRYKNAGTDGKDLGANVPLLNSLMVGVE